MYALCSFSYLGAMIASNHALQFLAYPTQVGSPLSARSAQVLGKSCKPVPVMLFGVLFARKRYPLRKYAFVLLIVLGVALFLYKEGKASSGGHTLGWGEVLLCLSLAMDGTTGAVQVGRPRPPSSSGRTASAPRTRWSRTASCTT